MALGDDILAAIDLLGEPTLGEIYNLIGRDKYSVVQVAMEFKELVIWGNIVEIIVYRMQKNGKNTAYTGYKRNTLLRRLGG